MNLKKLALIGSLAGLSGCYTVPVRSVVVAPAVVTPAPVVVTPSPFVVPAYPVYCPLWFRPRFHHRCRW